ncbi:hypothetical protein VTK73DRAFT_3197 [Phialemonium thermophilum]|uniref:Uncharacterized protein n=1 Tax=Phialemonium thermophilum TaxID=223376 RepID=A0ABR3VKH6_9PEZI
MRMEIKAKIKARDVAMKTTPVWSVGVITANGGAWPGGKLPEASVALLDILRLPDSVLHYCYTAMCSVTDSAGNSSSRKKEREIWVPSSTGTRREGSRSEEESGQGRKASRVSESQAGWGCEGGRPEDGWCVFLLHQDCCCCVALDLRTEAGCPVG